MYFSVINEKNSLKKSAHVTMKIREILVVTLNPQSLEILPLDVVL